MSKLIDFNSPEKEVLLEVFEKIPMMDKWIASLIDPKNPTRKVGERKDKYGNKYRILTKFGKEFRESKKEYIGEYKEWYEEWSKGWDGVWYIKSRKQKIQAVYKDYGILEGEYKEWWENKRMKKQAFYKDSKLEGEYKEWYDNGNIWIQTTCKNGKIIYENSCIIM